MDYFGLIINFKSYFLKVDSSVDLCIVLNILLYFIRYLFISHLSYAVIYGS